MTRHTLILSLLLLGCSQEFSAAEDIDSRQGGDNKTGQGGSSAGSYTSSGGSSNKAGTGGTVAPQGGSGGTNQGGSGGTNQGGSGGTNQGGEGGEGNDAGEGGMGGSDTEGSGGSMAGTGGIDSTGGTGGQGQGGSAGTGSSGGTSGNNGSGGSSGSTGGMNQAGTGGSSAGTGGTGGGPQTGPCDNEDYLLCETFDDDPLGLVPGAPWLDKMAECQDPGYVLGVSDSQSQSPSRSLLSRKMVNDACTLQADLGPVDEVYVRAWVYLTAQPGTQDRTSFFTVAPTREASYHSVRVGLSGIFCPAGTVSMKVVGDEEFLGCTGTPIPANTWTCLEVKISSSASGTTADLSINDVDQAYVVRGQARNSLSAFEAISPTYLRLGSVGDGMAYDPSIYLDDVVVSTSPIGCGE